MKRFLALLLASVMILGMVACGKTESTETTTASTETTTDFQQENKETTTEATTTAETTTEETTTEETTTEETTKEEETTTETQIPETPDTSRMFDESKIVLSPENPKYAPFVYIKEELNSIKILGKAVAFQSVIR